MRFPRSGRRPQTEKPGDNAPLSQPYVRRASRKRHRQRGAALGLVSSHPRPWRRAVHRSARPLRHHPGGRRSRQSGVQDRRDAALRMGGARRRQGAPAAGRHRESRSADRGGRGLRPRDRGSGTGRRTADAGLRRPGISRGDPAQISFPRPAPRASASQHHEARRHHRLAAAADEGAGLLRIPDADPHRLLAGRRARLSRAVAPASGEVLRAAAGAAAVQAADHDLRLRPLLPDRAVLSRRGRARRPLARRVLSARHRDELRHAGGCVRRGRAGAARRVRGVRRRQAGDAEISAHPLRRGDDKIRNRQAGPAQSDRDAGRLRDFPRLRLQGLCAHPGRERHGRGLGDPSAARRLARLLRSHEFVGAGRGPAGPRLYLLRAGQRHRRRPRSGRQQFGAGATENGCARCSG